MRGEEDGVSQNDLEALITGQHPKGEPPGPSLDPGPDSAQKVVSGKWVCAQSSQSKTNNFNKHITDKLEVLAKAYTHQGDKWRALGYSKAVNALKSYHKPVTSYQVTNADAFNIMLLVVSVVCIFVGYIVANTFLRGWQIIFSAQYRHYFTYIPLLIRTLCFACFRRLVRSQELENAWPTKLMRSWRAVTCGS